MSILGQPGERDELHRLRANEIYLPRKDTRESGRTLGSGTLACPSCDVPVVMPGPVPIGAVMRCPFCRELHPARGFLRMGEADTSLNVVRVTARIAP
jgi:hypothetical protein